MNIKHYFFAIGLLGFTGLAVAAGTAEFRAVDDAGKSAAMQFQWRDAHTAKMTILDPSAQGAEMLILDQGTYMVVRGQVMAMDGFAAKGQPVIGGESELISLTGPQGSRQVAGYTGGVYRMRWRDRNGEQEQTAVLSDDPMVREMTDAWMHATARLAGQSQAEAASIGSALRDRGLGILAVDGAFEITRLDDAAPPAEAFELPGGAAQSSPGGGMFSNLRNMIPGMAEDKAGRQSQRQTENVDRRVHEETDSYIDRKVDGFLNSIFGQ